MAVKRWNGTSWEIYAGSDLAPVKVTDGRLGKTTFIGATTPTGMVDGDIWIDQDTATNAVVPTALLAKGDIFVATGNGAYTRLAAGNSGESLYVDSSTSTGLRWQGDYNVGKNRLINADFSINQRGFVSTTGSAYHFDRWQGAGSGGTITYSPQTFTLGSAPVAGYEANNYYQIAITNQSAAGDYAIQRQFIESVKSFAGQTVTLSFWAKANSGTPSIAADFYQYFGTGGTPSSTVDVTGQKATISTSWARYSFTYNIPSIAGKTIGTNNNDYLALRIWSSAGSTYNANTNSLGIQNVTIGIWGVQLEAGSVATPFTTNTGNRQAELAACQRYYWRNTATQNYSIMGMGFASSSTNVMAYFQFPVTMRTTPSSIDFSTLQANDSSTGVAISNIGFQGTEYGPSGAVVNCTTSGMTTYRPTKILSNGSASGYIGFSAEL